MFRPPGEVVEYDGIGRFGTGHTPRCPVSVLDAIRSSVFLSSGYEVTVGTTDWDKLRGGARATRYAAGTTQSLRGIIISLRWLFLDNDFILRKLLIGMPKSSIIK